MTSIILGGLALLGINLSNNNGDNISQKSQNITTDNINYNTNISGNINYNTNISGKINKIQKHQADNLKKSIEKNKPEFLNQFDELTFDNINTPVSTTESNITINGMNQSLQRNLDIVNGYSNLNDALDYNVVTKDKFTHNNMTPSTTKRDFTTDSNNSQRRLEYTTGVSNFYVPKQEKYHLFEPMKNLSYVNGMPVMIDRLDGRYITSFKNNNGNLPFQNNVFVKPGLDGQNRDGLGAVYRVNPKTVDELRSENNQKMTYDNKPLETIKKGELRGIDFNLTKFKLPDFRETKFNNLVQGRSQYDAPKKTGNFTDIDTMRGDMEIGYHGPANNSNMGNAPNKNTSKYEKAKKENFYNDPTHSIVGVNNKPILQNKSSFTNCETQRVSTNTTQTGSMYNNNGGSYVLDPKDVPLTTNKELLLNGDTNLGLVGSQQQGNYIFSNDMILPTTSRQITSHNIVLGTRSENNNVNLIPTDSMKPTINQTTLTYKGGHINPVEKGHNLMLTDSMKPTINQTTLTYRGGHTNPTEKGHNVMLTDSMKPTINQTTLTYKGGHINPTEKGHNVMLTDSMKPTINQTTLTYKGGHINPVEKGHNVMLTDSMKPTINQTTLTYKGGHINPVEKGHNVMLTDNMKPTINQTTLTYKGGHINPVEKGHNVMLTDSMKPTIKQTTENNLYEGPLYGTDNYSGYTRDLKDSAKVTIKQTTFLTDYTGGIKTDVENQISHDSANNMTIKDKREILTFNRPANGKSDKNGPQLNKNTVKFNNKKTSIFYISNPRKGLDNIVMPSQNQSYIDNTFKNIKPQLSYGDYSTNNVFINTLDDNPLVNDLLHQKNY